MVVEMKVIYFWLFLLKLRKIEDIRWLFGYNLSDYERYVGGDGENNGVVRSNIFLDSSLIFI